MRDDIYEELFTDLPLYSRENLKIKPKIGPVIPLVMNKAQLYLHMRAEEQKRRTGKVRIIVLKGRQQGLSTYIAARLYHQTTCLPSIFTFIFAHDTEGSDTLYGMVQTFHAHSDPRLAPRLGNSNAKELLFPRLGGGYKVGTAGTGKGLGRSKTFQRLHWSEVAYSPNADEHSTGIMQTIPDQEGTEIFLESTSAGAGDFFFRMSMEALNGGSDYELVFIPWYWQDEYKRSMPLGFELEKKQANDEHPSEEEYYELFKKDGLTIEHLVWRRHKIKSEFQGDITRFMREYPFTPEEAFEAASDDCYIKPMLIRRARNHPLIPTAAPLIFGVDPARLGGDKFRVAHRKGRNIPKIDLIPAGRTDETSQRLAILINKYQPVRVNIDCGGLGVGVYDNLVGAGYGKIVRKVDFGSAALNPDINKNRRAELHRKFKDWLEDSPCSITCDPKDADKLQSQCAVVKAKWVNNAQLLLTPKEDIKKDLKYSPDELDSCVTTFADEVANPDTNKHARHQEVIIADTGFSGLN